ncbi:MAG: hypothetical protein JW741_09980 [Sedimentisphaerales bacterium]|nr:hypothetical protein [Sedimentisphaerales bacterium]
MAAIYDELRKAIRASDKSRYRLWQETGIDQGQLARFMAEDCGLSVESTERVAEALGLEIVVRPKRKHQKAKRKVVKHGKRNQ